MSLGRRERRAAKLCRKEGWETGSHLGDSVEKGQKPAFSMVERLLIRGLKFG